MRGTVVTVDELTTIKLGSGIPPNIFQKKKINTKSNGNFRIWAVIHSANDSYHISHVQSEMLNRGLIDDSSVPCSHMTNK